MKGKYLNQPIDTSLPGQYYAQNENVLVRALQWKNMIVQVGDHYELIYNTAQMNRFLGAEEKDGQLLPRIEPPKYLYDEHRYESPYATLYWNEELSVPIKEGTYIIAVEDEGFHVCPEEIFIERYHPIHESHPEPEWYKRNLRTRVRTLQYDGHNVEDIKKFIRNFDPSPTVHENGEITGTALVTYEYSLKPGDYVGNIPWQNSPNNFVFITAGDLEANYTLIPKKVKEPEPPKPEPEIPDSIEPDWRKFTPSKDWQYDEIPTNQRFFWTTKEPE